MTTAEFLSSLRRLDVKVWVEKGEIYCNAPKGVLTPALRAELAEREAEILAFLRSAASAARLTEFPLQRVSRDGNLPLSFAQQRLWFFDQLEPGSSAYNISTGFRLTGPLDVAALERSLNEIVRRHEALRTSFAVVDGQPVQVIAPAERFKLALVDLQKLPEAERETEARRLASEEAQGPFDLARGPLVRAGLLRLGEREHVLLLTMHHILSDGWSMGVLFRELSVLYEAFSNGDPSPLPELPVQYADFAVWQRQWLQGEVLEEQLSYWRERLGGAPPVLHLPTDRPRPAVQTYRGARKTLRLPNKLTDALKVLSRREEVTLFMTLLSAFKTLLCRYTGQEDIVVGSPIAGRTRPETEGLIGFFVNTLVLRSDLSGNPTFRQLLGRVREVALGAYTHQDLPFEKLVEELQPERNLSHTPLFQVMFALQNVPRKPLELPGLTLSPMQLGIDTAKFDLTLAMVEQDRELSCLFEYNTDLFDAATITRMGGHFKTLLEGIVANPGRRLSELPILTDAERRQLLVEWNDTKRDYPKDQRIHELFEAQVERSPEAVAVVFEDKQLTYRELNCRANQLARYLKRLGVGPEVLVGICVERSLEMVVGLLGILKAGGAYLPLDPEYPKERLAFMLKDAQVPVLLTQQQQLGRLPQHEAQVVCLDADGEAIGQESRQNPVSHVTADNLAYVIYTSGSTGTPKGVPISHRSLALHCADIKRHYELSPCDRVLLFSPLNFDVSLEQILPTLMVGATLILRDTELWSPEEFPRKISDFQITVVNLPTAYWQQLAQAWSLIESSLNTRLRLITVGGEAMLSGPLKRWQRTPLNRVPLLNAYGPTETTITATTFVVRPGMSGSDVPEVIPIGRPVGDRKVYISDSHGNPVPIGVPGELHIGGSCLARGYFNRPDLTAVSFIPNPFSSEPGARLYKTGDLARYLPDGNIEFLGRLDHQVKLRGFRIELGEIEAVLSQHPDAQESVVTARDDGAGDKLLVAYIVPSRESRPTINMLRNFLKQKLPDYMVPSAFVFLDALPLTPSGKVDRRALPAPDQSRPELESPFVAPRTPVEEALAGIWAEVLKLKQVGVRDNFFDLGGHSLLATQVMSRVRAVLKVELPLRALFEKPTIAELSSVIMAVKEEEHERFDHLVSELEALSDEEAKRLLAREEPQREPNSFPASKPISS